MELQDIRWVLFDAVGTLIEADPPVPHVYLAAGQHFGSRISTPTAVGKRFANAYHAVFGNRDHERDLRTSAQLERTRWQEVVAQVFDDVRGADQLALFESLWEHFGDAAKWRLRPGAEAAWELATQRGWRIGIASNFDQRLVNIVAELPPLAGVDRLYYSEAIGWAKPADLFYQHIEQDLGIESRQILMIGDDGVNDFEAPRARGWQALRVSPTTNLAELLAS